MSELLCKCHICKARTTDSVDSDEEGEKHHIPLMEKDLAVEILEKKQKQNKEAFSDETRSYSNIDELFNHLGITQFTYETA